VGAGTGQITFSSIFLPMNPLLLCGHDGSLGFCAQQASYDDGDTVAQLPPTGDGLGLGLLAGT
jgi:hypothetical protein